MFLKTLAKRQQKQRFAFPSHSGKSMSNYILGVSWIFQALSSSSTHTAGTIRESVSAWLENMKWKSWELMTTSMTAANPGGQLSCCLMLWWTAEGYHSSWLANTGPVSCLWYWQMHTRNPSMQKKENETVTVNERVWQMIDFKQLHLIKCLHQIYQHSWKAHIQNHSPCFVFDDFTQIIPVLHKSWIMSSDSFRPIMLMVRVGVFSNFSVCQVIIINEAIPTSLFVNHVDRVWLLLIEQSSPITLSRPRTQIRPERCPGDWLHLRQK